METTHSRAKKGGEFGANGEWYEGGKFIATTDHAKKLGSHKAYKVRRVEIESGVWTDSREGFISLWASLAGVEMFNRQFKQFSFNPNLRGENYASADAIDQRKAYISQFNEGKRWKSTTSYDFA